MTYKDYIDIAGGWAAIFTLGVAFIGYRKYRRDKRRNKTALEHYLKGEKEGGRDKGQRTFINIMAKTGLSQAEIFEASRTSKHIIRRIKTDNTGQWATDLLFEYERNGNSN